MPIRRATRDVLVDVGLGLAVTVALSVVITADQAGERSPDLVAYGWAVGLGALMLARRRYPRIVLTVSVLGFIAYHMLGYPAVPISLAAAAPLYSAAERRHTVFAIAGAALLVVLSVTARLLQGQTFAYVVGFELASHIALMGVAILLGAMVRLRQEAVAARERVLELQDREREHHVAQRVREERIAIATELHDSIGHSLTVVSIHANVADQTLATDPARAHEAIGNVKAAASESLRELRSTVGLLRSDAAAAPASSAQLEPLLEAAASAGVAVARDIHLDGAPGYATTAAYRIVQEAVANAMRHAAATRLSVRAWLDDDAVHVRVENDGVDGGAISKPGGLGLAAMHERAEALGGHLAAERRGSEFVVAAMIPVGPR